MPVPTTNEISTMRVNLISYLKNAIKISTDALCRNLKKLKYTSVKPVTKFYIVLEQKDQRELHGIFSKLLKSILFPIFDIYRKKKNNK